MRSVAFIVLFLGLSFASVLADNGKGRDDNGKGGDDNGGDNSRRNFIMGQSGGPNNFVVSSDHSSRHTQDSISFRIATDNTPRTTVTYANLTRSKGDRTGVTLFNRWRLWKLVEFNKGRNVTEPGYFPASDTRVSQVKLYQLTWSPFTVTNSITGNNVTSYNACSTGTNNSPGFSVKFCGQITNAANPTAALAPNYLKWSLAVNSYPYTGNGTSLALKVSFESAFAQWNSINRPDSLNATSNSGKSQRHVDISADGPVRTVASWDSSVSLTGGASCPSTANITFGTRFPTQPPADRDDDSKSDSDLGSSPTNLVIGYYSVLDGGCQPATVLWDPYTGFDDATQNSPMSGDSSTLTATVFAVIVAAALLM